MIRVEFRSLLSETALATNKDSEIMDLYTKEGFAIQAKWTNLGGLTGTIKLQASVDNVNYVDVPSSEQTITGTSNGYIWNASWVYYRSVKAVVTISAGAADVEICGNSKGF